MNDMVITVMVTVLIVCGAALFLGHVRWRKETALRLRRVGAVAHSKVMILPAKLRNDKTDREIYDVISFVRNVVASGNTSVLTPDKLLEQFADRGGAVGTASLKALALLRVNRTEEAATVFAETAGTKSAQDFIGILLRFDRISPEKLASTLGAYQAAMKEFRTTSLKRRNETLSDMVFLPVIVNVMAVFMNFIIVAYFLAQKNQLMEMFF